MGYCSDVRMVIGGATDEILNGFAHLRLTADKNMIEALDEWEVKADNSNGTGRAVAILGRGGVSWKWHESYSDVIAHNTIFRYFQDMSDSDDSTVNGGFIRIGENDDDIETAYFGNDYPADFVRSVRSIQCDYDDLNGDDLRPRIAQTSA